jgi:hypothetical protein
MATSDSATIRMNKTSLQSGEDVFSLTGADSAVATASARKVNRGFLGGSVMRQTGGPAPKSLLEASVPEPSIGILCDWPTFPCLKTQERYCIQ